MSDKRVTVAGPGSPVLLTVLFVALKLCGVIDWSWLWVLAPSWIPLSVGLAIAAVSLLVWLAVQFLGRSGRRSKTR